MRALRSSALCCPSTWRVLHCQGVCLLLLWITCRGLASMISSQCVSSRCDDLMVFVNAMARLKGADRLLHPYLLFSGFCSARQQPTTFAASVRLESRCRFVRKMRLEQHRVNVLLVDMVRTTTL